MKKRIIYISIAIALLLTLAFISITYFSRKPDVKPGSRLLTINVDKLQGWEVTPPSSENKYTIIKQDGVWKVQLGPEYFADANQEYVERSIRHLNELVPVKIAEGGKEKWNEYHLTDSATIVKVMVEGEEPIKLYVGKLEFFNTSQAHFYIRKQGDDNIYIVTNYLRGSLAADLKDIRAKHIAPLPAQLINEIHILHSNGSHIDLKRENNLWMVNNKAADQAKAREYVYMLSAIEMQKFTDRPQTGAERTILINAENMPGISLKIYSKSDNLWALESDVNKGNTMAMDEKLMALLFPSAEYFLP